MMSQVTLVMLDCHLTQRFSLKEATLLPYNPSTKLYHCTHVHVNKVSSLQEAALKDQEA